MAYVEDIAASASLSFADAFSSMNAIQFGSKNYNFGGTQTLKTSAAQSPTAEVNPEARAVSATAKAGDGGVASSSALLSETAGLGAIGGINITTILLTALIALAAGLGFYAITKKGKA